MDIDVKTNLFEDTNPLLDAGSDQDLQGAQPTDMSVETSEGDISSIPWKQESWLSTIAYWFDEIIWRRKYWNKLRTKGNQQ